jgi:hypothetical protein
VDFVMIHYFVGTTVRNTQGQQHVFVSTARVKEL